MSHWMERDWPNEDCRDVMLKKLCKLVKRFIDDTDLPITELVDAQVGEIEDLMDEITSFYEPQDPRSMGWVGDDGLP